MISPEQSGDIKKNYCGHKIELFLDNLGNQELDNLRDHKHADVYVSYNGGAIINGTLYTQGGVDGVVVIIDGTTGEPRGTLTVEDGEIIVTGSMFDGTFKLME